jgi:tRNA-splicing ligase RtcB
MSNLYKIKSLIPFTDMEIEAQNQIYDIIKYDFVKEIAIMPDVHTGYTVPIGSVVLLDKVISPSLVSFDIGCGMGCIVTDIDARDLSNKDRVKIYDKIVDRIPTGFSAHSYSKSYQEFKSYYGDKELNKKVNEKLLKQIGTLGGGNHFIELGENKEGKLTITLHSGSRNIGHSIAGFYMTLSNNVDKELPNGFLNIASEAGIAYNRDMNFALEYALENRKRMLLEILDIVGAPSILINKMINENHNHAIINSDGTVLHRKGATPAELGQLGVIPGNMRDGVYITKGLGNETYLKSASHGAGRKMSRSKASKSIDQDIFIKQMKGIVCSTDKNILDEAPDAYKDLDKVVDMQIGVVIEVVDYVKPIINVKASESPRKRRK